MNKLIALVAAFATTTSLYATSAEAGCGGYHRASYRAVARVSKPRQQSVAAAKPAAQDDSKKVADAPIAEKTETVALNSAPVSENSSIVTGAPKIADAKPATAKVDAKAVEKVATTATGVKDCKQFFPSAGITLSVRCQ
jgi:hypothetical protein